MYWSLFNASYQESVPPLYNQSFLFFPFLRFVSLLLSSVNWVMEFLAQSFSSASQHFGTKHFGQWHFRTEISSPGHFGTCTFRLCRFSGTWIFRLRGRFGTRSFRHREFLVQWFFGTMDVSAWGHFSKWTFWHSSTGAKMSVPKRPYCFARCKNIHVPKCSGDEISLAKMSMVPKIPCASASAGPKHAHAEMFR